MLEEKNIIDQNSSLISYLKKVRRPIVLEEIILELEATGQPDPKLVSVKEELQKIEAVVCVPLFAEDRLIGLFNLGEKTTQEMYTDEDIELLNTLSDLGIL